MKKAHLYEIDLMRACIILGVVCVHVLSFLNTQTRPLSWTNLAFDTSMMTFHFTREAFMFITGVVLFYTYYHRSFISVSFWKKRFFLIAIPYLAWTGLYILFEGTYLTKFEWNTQWLIHHFIKAILTGNQYFLYFLVISIQLYVFFPLMVKMLKWMENHHKWVFIVSFALELGFMVFNKFYLQHIDAYTLPPLIRTIDHYRDRFILTYQFWFVSGALMAIHYEKVRAWMEEHRRAVFVTCLSGILVLWGHFALDRLLLHQSEDIATLVLQPIMIPYSLLVAVTLWTAGLAYVRARTNPSMQAWRRVIEFFGGTSFGIFLLHPITLHYIAVIDGLWHPHGIGKALFIPFAIFVTYSGAAGLAYVIGKIPYVSYIVGQKTKANRARLSVHASHAA